MILPGLIENNRQDVYLVCGGLQVLNAAQQQVGSGLVLLQQVVVAGTAGGSGTDQESEDAKRVEDKGSTVN